MPSRRKSAARRRPWNEGVVVGKKGAFTPEQVKRIRRLLADRGIHGLRDLTLFSIAIDTMLHPLDLLPLVVSDVQHRNGSIRSVFEVTRRARGSRPVRCALSKPTASALERWIRTTGKKRTDYLFPSRKFEHQPVTPRQLSRLLKRWVTEAGLDATDYGAESLRRTKALHILKGSGDLQVVRALLGHARIESTARYLGVETESDPIEVCRAFDI
jgi:integrase